MNWRSKAACQGEETELFFPIGSSGPALDQIEQAKAICQRCEVALQCRDWALETNQHDGVWGGLSEEERHSLRRSRQRDRRTR